MRLTYHRNLEFRSGSRTLLLLVLLDVPLLLGVLYVLPPLWRWIVGVLFGGAEGWVFGAILLLPRFRPHLLTDTTLLLRFPLHFRLPVAREQIAAVAPWPRSVDTGFVGSVLLYDRTEDALVMSTRARELVEIVLHEPVTVRLRGERYEASRLLLGVDEPLLLLSALGGACTAAPMARVVEASPSAAAESNCRGAGLVVVGLQKSYGSLAAVQGVSLAIAPGEIVALLGANGAGKSTTLQMIAGLLRPDAGRVWVDGHDAWAEPLTARAVFSYVPDNALLHESLTPREFLWFLGDLYGMEPAVARARTEALLARLGLTRRADTWIRGFSLGMRRKVSLAAGLLHQPRVLVLDEVTNGLDPLANREVLTLLQQSAQEGAAVLLATHILPVAEEIAHRIAVMHQGELCAVGTLPELRAAAGLPADASLEQVFVAFTVGGVPQCA